MDPSALIAGLIISACYDLIKRSLNKVIAPTFSKVYDETIDELSQKYENIDRLCFDAFFRDEKVKEEVNKFKERNEVDLEIVTNEFKRFFDEKENNVDPETVLNDFFIILELKMAGVPELKDKLEMRYLRDLKSDHVGFKSDLDEIKGLIERNHDFLQKSTLLSQLAEKSNPALGLVKNEFQNIHLFLDELNKLLNNEFVIVKKRYYPDAWSIGMAYYKYEGCRVTYTLYPIPLNKNDVQIKEVNEELHRQLEEEGLGFTARYTENPINIRPKEYAREIIQSETQRLLENRLLEHQGNQFLAKEFIIEFIDKFHVQLGLEEKEEYTLEEVEKAFYHYLPIWIDEAVAIIVNLGRNNRNRPEDCLHRDNAGRRLPYFDPDELARMIMSDERDTIKGNVARRLDQEKINVPRLLLGNDRFPFAKIERVYLPKDYSIVFAPEAVEKNLKTFFENLPQVYYDLLSQNFPLLKDKLSPFGVASKILIVFDVKEECASHHDAKIQIYCLKSREESGIKIEVFPKREKRVPDVFSIDFEKGVEFDGRRYDIISASTKVLSEDLPMLNYVYKMLEDCLKNYFAM
jgi:uncharacterized protein YqgQ